MTNERGFTLIETLIALAIGSSVVAVVLSTLRTTSEMATRSVAVANEAEEFSRTGTILAGDIWHSKRLRDGSGRLIFVGKSNKVSFPSTARFPAEGSLLIEYRLRLADGGTDLVRSNAILLSEGGHGPLTAEQIIWHGPGTWEFHYLDNNTTWHREWTDSNLPRALSLVDLADPGSAKLVANFPMSIEPECAMGPGPNCSLPPEVFP